MSSNNSRSSWRERVPAIVPEDNSYLALSFEERLTTTIAGDPLGGYRGLGCHAMLLTEEFAAREHAAMQAQTIGVAASQEPGGATLVDGLVAEVESYLDQQGARVS